VWKKAALLAAALAFALPAIADNSSNSKPPVTKPKPKANRVLERNSVSFGEPNSVTVPKGNGNAAGKVPIGSIHVKKYASIYNGCEIMWSGRRYFLLTMK